VKSIASVLVFGGLIGASQPASAQSATLQQKLVATDYLCVNYPTCTSPVEQGYSVGLSADGNTAIVGGPWDNDGVGAAWVWTRNNLGVWSEQQKLIATNTCGANTCGPIGPAYQGLSVALSDDGLTAIVGGPSDNSNLGAAWVWTLNSSSGVWTQQAKLVGTGASPDGAGPQQGSSVALSFNGNFAIVGGPYDDPALDKEYPGAAWVFYRNGAPPSWNQVGPKLVGDNIANGAAEQGWSVALSPDGLWALLGGPADNEYIGATWVFGLVVYGPGCGSVPPPCYAQNGPKLVGTATGGVPTGGQGKSVAVSSGPPYIALVGAPVGNGAVWAFSANSDGLFSQLDPQPLVGTGASSGSGQGWSVAFSADSNVAFVSGPDDNGALGAAWVFTDFLGSFSQSGSKLADTTASSGSGQGWSVALSSDGRTGIVGGPFDNSSVGAAWVWVASSPFDVLIAKTHDFNGDGISDLLWRDSSGDVAIWLMNGSQLLNTGGLGNVPATWLIIGQRDFTGGGYTDLLWRDTSGDLAMWLMNGLTVSSTAGLGNVPSNWTVYGTGDLNGDGKGDLLWRDNLGNVAIWFMNGTQVASTASLGQVPTNWTIIGDDNKGDILWRDTAGDVAIWQVSGSQVVASASLGTVPSAWVIAGLGDFNGDGVTDILWRDSNTGTVAIWFLTSSLTVQSTASLGVVPSNWNIFQTGDYNGDGMSDILWKDNTGNLAVWFMNGGAVASTAGYGNVGTSWSVQSLNAE
jgi:hypothetical protein